MAGTNVFFVVLSVKNRVTFKIGFGPLIRLYIGMDYAVQEHCLIKLQNATLCHLVQCSRKLFEGTDAILTDAKAAIIGVSCTLTQRVALACTGCQERIRHTG